MTDAAVERYAREGSLVLGGAAAILLQLADPVVARGVAEHSAFALDPVRRLRHTLTFVYGATLGSEEERAAVARFVNRSHDSVPGATSAPHQLWVAATLYRVGLDVHERLFGPLSPADADAVYARSALLGTTLQLPPGAWPDDRHAFDRYWHASVAGAGSTTIPGDGIRADAPGPVIPLEIRDDARSVARQLLHPSGPGMPWWGRAAMPLVRRLTPRLLPPEIARAYDLDPSAGRVAWAVMRVIARLTPRRVRQLPSRRLLAALGRH